MKIGIQKEIKPNENRISLVPAGAAALVSAGHTVVVDVNQRAVAIPVAFGLGTHQLDRRLPVAQQRQGRRGQIGVP